MKMSEVFLQEFDQEMANTRKVLDRIPEDKFAWKPHEKSFTMLKLATHVTTLSRLATIALETDSLDMAHFTPPPEPKSRMEILEIFDKLSSAARSRIAASNDEALSAPWSLKNGNVTIFTMPKSSVLRRMFMNHIIHHRAQLTVYLRMNNVPLPGLYGPSADER
jgi:uncharacterized damage-inducible protein DinB